MNCATLSREYFTQTDPLQATVGQAYPSSYVYGNNNPLRFTDPNGLRSQTVSSAVPIVDQRSVPVPPDRRSVWQKVLSSYNTGGSCLGVAAGAGWSGEATVCVVKGRGEGWSPLASAGFGTGLELSATGGAFFSNAPSANDILGNAACQSYGRGAAGAELCEFISGGKTYLSIYLAAGPSAKVSEWFDKASKSTSSGHITFVKTYRVSSLVGAGAQALINADPTGSLKATQDVFIDGVTNGGRKTKSSINTICQLAGLCGG